MVDSKVQCPKLQKAQTHNRKHLQRRTNKLSPFYTSKYTIHVAISSSGSAVTPSSLQISKNYGTTSVRGCRRLGASLTLLVCAAESSLVTIGVIAKGSVSHVSGRSCLRTAARSPTLLFLPITNFAHFLSYGHCLFDRRGINEPTLRTERRVFSDALSAT